MFDGGDVGIWFWICWVVLFVVECCVVVVEFWVVVFVGVVVVFGDGGG